MASRIEFIRGDGNTHTFQMPASAWQPGGKLFFAAKPAIDDDNTDSNAVISGVFDDTAVTDTTYRGVAYKKYTCYFPPSATNSIISDGAGSLDYLGEFQYVSPTGVPITVPATDDKLDCVVYFDVKRKVVP